MSSIAIFVTAPGGSPIDYTSACVFADCSFTQQMNATPGTFSIKLRDPDQTLSFVTGSEVTLEVDGVLLFGGYATVVEMGSFAPADDVPVNPADYELRTWTLSGPDYNIIFDKRVWRNTVDYLSAIQLTTGPDDGPQLIEALSNYADLSDFDTSSGIETIASVFANDALQQGETLRGRFEVYAQFGGAVWYASPAKVFIYKPYDNAVKRWGFSDDPNKTPITASPSTYQGATYPFRQVAGTEDASYMVNDALVWGGSQFAGASGGTVFARSQDATSISAHHRWQVGETHFGEKLFSIQDQVDARADVIINGPPGADATGQQKGLKNPQQQFTFTWFSPDVPKLSGVPDHVVPGDILNIELAVFGVTTLLPLRELRMSFPDALDPVDNSHVVQFDGTFGLQLSDPFSLWRFLLAQRNQQITQVTTPTVVTDSSTSTTYGAQFAGVPTPAPDGATTVFSMPFGYIPGSTQVFINGLGQRLGTDYTESDNVAGEITFTSAPISTDTLYMVALTLAS